MRLAPRSIFPVLNNQIIKLAQKFLFQFTAFCAIVILTSLLVFRYSPPMEPPELDARRYANYALNLFDHKVFGISGTNREIAPEPGFANSPLYPAFVAGIMAFDPRIGDSLRCELGKIGTELTPECPRFYANLSAAQIALAGLSLIALWLTTQLLFGRYLISWLASILAYGSTKPNFFAHQILTENLVLFFFAFLLLISCAALRYRRDYLWVIVGALLACLTLTRPEYLYLCLASMLSMLAAALLIRHRRLFVQLFLLLIGCGVVLGPWMVRNEIYFDQFAVTGGYGDKTIAYRASYNLMNEEEWQAAFVYWLPGHGETLAKKLLPETSYAKLGTDENSYLYKEGVEIFEQGLAAVHGDRGRLTGYLIKTQVLEKPVEHFLSSIPLAWRGVLTGKYLAVIGLPSFILMLAYSARQKHYAILLLSLPALVMISLYAAVSVSIPRYNIYLIYYYGIASAWLFVSVFDLLLRRRANR